MVFLYAAHAAKGLVLVFTRTAFLHRHRIAPIPSPLSPIQHQRPDIQFTRNSSWDHRPVTGYEKVETAAESG